MYQMTKRCIALFSGGLDSLLAIRIMQEQGVEVEAITLKTIFTCCDALASTGARELGVRLTVCSQEDDYLDVLRRPKFGRGRGANPCVDCRIYMFERAKRFMKELDAQFIVSGEVVGLPKEGVGGVFLYVRDQRASGDPRKLDDWKLRTFDGLALQGNGPFKTERIPPGKYKVVVEAYKQETPGEMSRSGWRLPKWTGTADVDVPESGEPPKVRLMMHSYDAHSKSPEQKAVRWDP